MEIFFLIVMCDVSDMCSDVSLCLSYLVEESTLNMGIVWEALATVLSTFLLYISLVRERDPMFQVLCTCLF